MVHGCAAQSQAPGPVGLSEWWPKAELNHGAITATAAELTAGTVAAGKADRLQCAASRLANGAPTTIALFGTSVTAGRGAGHSAASYPHVLGKMLRERFPQSNATVRTFAYPGAGAPYMAACTDRMVPIRADIYVVEVVDNLMPLRDAAYVQARDAVASIADTLTSRGDGDAALLLAPFPQSCSKRLLRSPPFESVCESGALTLARCLGTEHGLAGMLEQLGRAMGLAVASARLALGAQLGDLLRGEVGNASSSELSAERARARVAWLARHLSHDAVHPNARGHQLLASLVVSAIARSLDTRLATWPGNDAAEGSQQERSRPCHAVGAAARRAGETAGEDRGVAWRSRGVAVRGAFARETHAVCAIGDDLRPMVLAQRGWRHAVEMSGDGHAKPGLEASGAGAVLDFCFSPPARAVERGERFRWQFAFLQTWRSVGAVEASCARGCTCSPAWASTHSSRRVAQPAIATVQGVVVRRSRAHRAASMLAARGAGEAETPPCPCTIRLTTLNESAFHSPALPRPRPDGHQATLPYQFKVIAVFSGFYLYSPRFLFAAQDAAPRTRGAASTEHQSGHLSVYSAATGR